MKIKLFLLSIVLAGSVSAFAQMTVTAHSGAYGTEDNSLEYIRTALDNDADVLEFDVRTRPDGSLAMSHDTIMSNDEGVLIEEVLRMIKGKRTRVNLDIKQGDVIGRVCALACRLGMRDQVFMTGVGRKWYNIAKKENHGVKYYLNYSFDEDKPVEDLAALAVMMRHLHNSGAIGINCSHEYASQMMSDMLHKEGYLLSLWTINKDEDIQRVLPLSPDNITSRDPLRVISWIKK